jgi:PIN domain nuclease of toxin-antitoxin system
MNVPLLLDTCAAVWISDGAQISRKAGDALTQSYADGRNLYVSPITAWEIGTLVSKGRLQTTLNPEVWFERFLKVPGVELARMSTKLLIASCFLPGTPPRDPADRIILTTAREEGFVVVTRDRILLDYAAQGHVAALEC